MKKSIQLMIVLALIIKSNNIYAQDIEFLHALHDNGINGAAAATDARRLNVHKI